MSQAFHASIRYYYKLIIGPLAGRPFTLILLNALTVYHPEKNFTVFREDLQSLAVKNLCFAL